MISELNIETALRGSSTYLKNAYFSQPFKLANITEDKSSSNLQLMLMSSSPGILDGDKYLININVADGCSLELKTQSYQRLFTMESGASQQIDINIHNGASFSYIPHPCVPHKKSSFATKTKIYLTETSNLKWGEVLTCGRKLNGEEFLFSKYHSLTEIFLNGRLFIKENLLISPHRVDVNAMGQLEGFSHQASFICIGGNSAKANMASVISHIQKLAGINWGLSKLSDNAFILRVLGHKAEQLHQLLKDVAMLTPITAEKPEHAI